MATQTIFPSGSVEKLIEYFLLLENLDKILPANFFTSVHRFNISNVRDLSKSGSVLPHSVRTIQPSTRSHINRPASLNHVSSKRSLRLHHVVLLEYLGDEDTQLVGSVSSPRPSDAPRKLGAAITALLVALDLGDRFDHLGPVGVRPVPHILPNTHRLLRVCFFKCSFGWPALSGPRNGTSSRSGWVPVMKIPKEGTLSIPVRSFPRPISTCGVRVAQLKALRGSGNAFDLADASI